MVLGRKHAGCFGYDLSRSPKAQRSIVAPFPNFRQVGLGLSVSFDKVLRAFKGSGVGSKIGDGLLKVPLLPDFFV